MSLEQLTQRALLPKCLLTTWPVAFQGLLIGVDELVLVQCLPSRELVPALIALERFACHKLVDMLRGQRSRASDLRPICVCICLSILLR